jgi:hypothetical protein
MLMKSCTRSADQEGAHCLPKTEWYYEAHFHGVTMRRIDRALSDKEHCPEVYLEVQGIPKDPIPALPSFLQHPGKGEEGHCQD